MDKLSQHLPQSSKRHELHDGKPTLLLRWNLENLYPVMRQTQRRPSMASLPQIKNIVAPQIDGFSLNQSVNVCSRQMLLKQAIFD